MAIHKIYLVFSFLLFLLACTEPNNSTTQKLAEESPTDTILTVKEDSLIRKDSLSEPASSSNLVKSTETPSVTQESEKTRYNFRYDINNPDQKINLKSELVEISGLTFDPAKNTLLAVNDEKGIIYRLAVQDGKIIEKTKFAGSGDYEGIEMIGHTVYVLKSNGRITPVDMKAEKVGKPFKTALTSSNDVEGLGYDPTQNKLILACKGAGALKKKSKLKDAKAFYRFDLESEKLDERPLFVIKDKELKDFLDQMSFKNVSKKGRKKLENRIEDFSPSAIARHPKSGHFYVLSSVGKSLVVCNAKGLILDIHFLSDKKFIQPEGICFAPDGTMYISNEGRSLVANILTFAYRQ